ncbi:DUF1995 family protein [Stenomitos frigidus]|uniref:DUF1995 domain-containing protein n=1 Tax=Stenomitos frigidus ULC18 TaxID=2107698 RepID=A0A2T1E9H0_9CYAN|nr:DUF1995 family protein [Stenomitos frigidus]PSB29397.1 DUF1995 domain-containing protein [Stenomitos frigidus ULC18]
MVDFPQTLEDAIAQAQSATQAAIAAGYTRLKIDLLLPELKPTPIALQYLSVFSELGTTLKVLFTDAGAAALARRDWGPISHQICSLDVAGARQTTPVEELVSSEDQMFLFVAPSSVEVSPVEQVCLAAGERPVILFAPRLEDIGTVGIGYAARKIRERFLNTFEPCYYVRPLDRAALLRCYPSPWQVWLESDNAYTLAAEELSKPSSERLEELLLQVGGSQASPKRGLLEEMQRFLKALGQ